MSPANRANPRRPASSRTWLVPAVSARNTWDVPAVGSNPLPPATRPLPGPRPTAPSARAERPSWRVPAVTGPRPTVRDDAWRPAAPAPRPVPVPPDEPPRHDPRPPADEAVELEHGDRALFLALARQRLARGIPVNAVHPPAEPPPGEARGHAPEPGYANLADGDLVATFARSVEEAGGVCHLVEGEIPETLLDHVVAELDGWEAVVSAEPEAVALGHSLSGRGVGVRPATPEAAAHATLGLTSATAGIAATGSIVLDSRRGGGRLASLLPPVHVCVLPADRIVATPAEVLRGLGDDPEALPPSLVLVTGPSRTGDIEQLLTIGAHGPTALHVIVVV